jgi:hypothetical protein
MRERADVPAYRASRSAIEPDRVQGVPPGLQPVHRVRGRDVRYQPRLLHRRNYRSGLLRTCGRLSPFPGDGVYGFVLVLRLCDVQRRRSLLRGASLRAPSRSIGKCLSGASLSEHVARDWGAFSGADLRGGRGMSERATMSTITHTDHPVEQRQRPHQRRVQRVRSFSDRELPPADGQLRRHAMPSRTSLLR